MAENTEKRTDLGTLGEFGLIEALTKSHEHIQPSTKYGVGDDAAVISMGDQDLLLSTDLLVEGLHFDLMYHPLKHLGYKAVVVNLSDIYAMNGTPRQILVSLSISNRFSVEAMEELYEGIYAACKHYSVDLVGGDTTSSQKGLTISITAVGTAGAEKTTYRNGAKEGDILCVSGDLGAAYLGLQIMEREKQIFLSTPDVQPDLEDQSYLISRQLKPEARGDIINQFQAAGVKPTSMIDISDGLASDIFHICKQSDVGVLIEEANVPIREEAETKAIDFKMDPITCALSGGEDYELLFTIAPEDYEKVRAMPSIYTIGEIKNKSYGKKLLSSGGNYHDLQAQGWMHF